MPVSMKKNTKKTSIKSDDDNDQYESMDSPITAIIKRNAKSIKNSKKSTDSKDKLSGKNIKRTKKEKKSADSTDNSPGKSIKRTKKEKKSADSTPRNDLEMKNECVKSMKNLENEIQPREQIGPSHNNENCNHSDTTTPQIQKLMDKDEEMTPMKSEVNVQKVNSCPEQKLAPPPHMTKEKLLVISGASQGPMNIDPEVNEKPKPYRLHPAIRPGSKKLNIHKNKVLRREIVSNFSNYQNFIPRKQFQRVVREIIQEMKEEIEENDPSTEVICKMSAKALYFLQEVTEKYIMESFGDGKLASAHGKRITVMNKDIDLADRIKLG